MNVAGRHFRTIWLKEGAPQTVQLIDQRYLPHQFVIEDVSDRRADGDCHPRHACARRGLDRRRGGLRHVSGGACSTTAPATSTRVSRNRGGAVESDAPDRGEPRLGCRSSARSRSAAATTSAEKIEIARRTADMIATEDAEHCRSIGEHGLELIRSIAASERRQAGQRSYALQRRLARVCRSRLCHRADLRGA